MPVLKHTKIFRGGITANHVSFESSKASFDCTEDSVYFRFSLASKGGGKTLVRFELGIEDVAEVLNQIALKQPEKSLGILNDATKKANAAILEVLSETRKKMVDQQTCASKVLTSLEKVEVFVAEKYNEAPSGEDDRESSAMEALSDATSSLRFDILDSKTIGWVFEIETTDDSLSDSEPCR